MAENPRRRDRATILQSARGRPASCIDAMMQDVTGNSSGRCLTPASRTQSAGCGRRGQGGRCFRRAAGYYWEVGRGSSSTNSHPAAVLRAISAVIARGGIRWLALRGGGGEAAPHDRSDPRYAGSAAGDLVTGGRRARQSGRSAPERGRAGGAGCRRGAGPQGRRAGHAARLQGGLDPLRRLVRRARLRARAGRPRHGRRLPGQPGRHPRPGHRAPPPGRDRQDAPLQRPAVERRAPRHRRPARRLVARARPPAAQGRRPHPGHAAPAGGHLRRLQPRAGATAPCC